MEDDRFEAGTLVHFDFSKLGGTWPEMIGEHPAVVISPKPMQQAGSVVIVPLSSSAAVNKNNPDAIPLTTTSVLKATRTGYSFAICNLPVAISLDRRTLEYFETRRDGRNRGRRHTVNNQDLKAIRRAVLKNILDPKTEFPAVKAVFEPAPVVDLKSELARLDRAAPTNGAVAVEAPRQSDVLKRLAERITERRLKGNRPRTKPARSEPTRLYLVQSLPTRPRFAAPASSSTLQ